MGFGLGKAFKKIKRSVKKIVDGAKNVVKKVWDNPIGKALTIAAGVYFGGAALGGAFAGLSSGAGVLSGALTGIQNAWTSLTMAGSSALAGEFGKAASHLAAGAKGSLLQSGAELAGATASSVGQGVSAAQSAGASASAASPGSSAITSVTSGASQAAGVDIAAAQGQASLASALKKAGFSASEIGEILSSPKSPGGIRALLRSPYLLPIGMSTVGSLLSASAEEKAEREERKRINENIKNTRYRSVYT